MRLLSSTVLAFFMLINAISASNAQSPEDNFLKVLNENHKLIQRSSTRTISPVLAKIQDSNFPGASEFLSKWQDKELWFRKSDNQFFYVTTDDEETYSLINVLTGEVVGDVGKRDIKQVKPNSGVRALLAAALVQFQLIDPDVNVRRSSLESLARNPKLEHLNALRLALERETDAALKSRLVRLERLLTIQFDEDQQARVAAIKSFDGDLSLDVRARLNPLLNSKVGLAKELPENINLARKIIPGKTAVNEDGTASQITNLAWFSNAQPELSLFEAYEKLVEQRFALPDISLDERKAILAENIIDGKVGRYDVAELNTQEAREEAYKDLVLLGTAEPVPTMAEKNALIESHVFYASYQEESKVVTDAARLVLASINSSVKLSGYIDLALDAISLASIYFLAAIGLAITFGVMRVINMAHGEFIMMGAYSGYVVQQVITNYTLSIIVAIPVAFMITFIAGVIMERTIIRHLYNRPLETLLATFGVSIALQQIAKNIFGTQARPLTSPDWLGGAWVLNDVIAISWIRIAIFVLSAIFFIGLLWILNRTRLGLETRAVTQNPRMAASMGIDPDKINMLTFGLGCGIAGVAGVAIGLYAKVTSELGSEYIVQSFMTVVVGGVGNIWGTLAGATLIGFLQKFIEYFNPSNTLAAQTYMIIFIIIFIQFRPKGLFALKGRAAEA